MPRMREDHFDPSAEPFGQQGVLPYVWPTFVILCAVGFCTCLLMLQRSQVVWDTVANTTSTQRVQVSSVIGRLVVTIIPYNYSSDSISEWDFDSRPFDSVQDGWEDSWKKTLGVEWGYERAPQFNRQPVGMWRLRIRWRTLAAVYAVPILIEMGRRGWRRFVRHQPLRRFHTTAA